jgi:hypothetical protein
MRKTVLGGVICFILFTAGCITLTTDEKTGNIILPPVIEEAIKATSPGIGGEEQVAELVKEGVSWLNSTLLTSTGGGIGITGLLYIGNLLLRARKRIAIMDDSMDAESKARAKESAKYTSVEKELA